MGQVSTARFNNQEPSIDDAVVAPPSHLSFVLAIEGLFGVRSLSGNRIKTYKSGWCANLWGTFPLWGSVFPGRTSGAR